MMRSRDQRLLSLLLTVLMVEVAALCPAIAEAQGTTGTITGRVIDAQGLAAPGATIAASSPNLQGTRTTVTSAAGDYILTLLPPGTYTISFDLPGFARTQKEASIGPAQSLTLDATLGPAAVSQVVQVTGSASALIGTAQTGASLSQAHISNLPTNRDIFASLQLAPSVHSTGPAGAPSIGGGPTFANGYSINGVPDGDNVRGQPYELYIEDGVEQIAIGSAGIAAEYGRFTGGVVNVVTKSGGNRFSGSLRDSLVNDAWRTLTPFEVASIESDANHKDTRGDETVPAYEYTFGGPAIRDRLWFFAAGRNQTQKTQRTLAFTNFPYTYRLAQQRYEGKATWAATRNHRLQGTFTGIHERQINQSFNPSVVMDVGSLYTENRPMNLLALVYDAVLSPRLSFEARVSARNETLDGVGGTSTDRIAGTVLSDRSGRRYWSPTFCGICGAEQRDGLDVFVKASYFLSAAHAGSHALSLGYDGYDDRRYANNHQSGSDFRIANTNPILTDAGVTAQFLADGVTQILWQPIVVPAGRTHFRTHSGFISDHWRMSDRVTATLGLRSDRNHAVDSSGILVAATDAWSPRVSVVVDLWGDQKWLVSASVAKYVDALANTVANAASAAGNADAYSFVYRGPDINADPGGPLTSTADGVRQVLDWFDANRAMLPITPLKVVGVTPIIDNSLESPSAWEYGGWIGRQFGAVAALRADFSYRNFNDFYVQRTDTGTGSVFDSRPQAPVGISRGPYDLTIIENTNLLTRQYAAVSLQGQYRIGTTVETGATYTLSRTWGNVDGEAANGPTANAALQYPEYKQASWNYPAGDLSTDQRHRARLWATYELPWLSGLAISGLQILESGVPYGAITVNFDPSALVPNPGYQSPPGLGSTQYYLTDRDAFRTAGQRRTDLAVNYRHKLRPLRGLEIFGQLQILNVFDQFQLCACGAASAVLDGSSVDISRISQSVRNSAFNPSATVPVEGLDWTKGPNFGGAVSRLAYTTPRTMRLTFGVRF